MVLQDSTTGENEIKDTWVNSVLFFVIECFIIDRIIYTIYLHLSYLDKLFHYSFVVFTLYSQ